MVGHFVCLQGGNNGEDKKWPEGGIYKSPDSDGGQVQAGMMSTEGSVWSTLVKEMNVFIGRTLGPAWHGSAHPCLISHSASIHSSLPHSLTPEMHTVEWMFLLCSITI